VGRAVFQRNVVTLPIAKFMESNLRPIPLTGRRRRMERVLRLPTRLDRVGSWPSTNFLFEASIIFSSWQALAKLIAPTRQASPWRF